MKLLVVSQTGCKPCELVKNFLDNGEVEYKVFDITNEDTVELQEGLEFTEEDLSLMGTPVTILFDDDGEEVSRVAGYNIASLKILIDQLDEQIQ